VARPEDTEKKNENATPAKGTSRRKTTAAGEKKTTAAATRPKAKAETPPKALGNGADTPKRRGGGLFLGIVLGGAVAAALGFGAARYADNAWPFQTGPSAADKLTAEIDGQRQQIAALKAQISTLSDAVQGKAEKADLQPLLDRIAAVSASVDELAGKLAAVEQRLSDLENRPVASTGASADAVATYEKELAAMRAMFQRELDRLKKAQSEATSSGQQAAGDARTTLRLAALAQLRAALTAGEPFSEALATLGGTGVDIPPVLKDAAATGVPTLADLQQEFPDAARRALAAAIREEADQGKIDRFTAFLRTQLGARTLTPKEGNDPDAVLSRAEAALRSGNLGRALSELEALPKAGRKAMSGWIERAERRKQAVEAVNAIASGLGK